MSLIFSMFPFYLLGNLHCAAMCGPLAALLGKHPHKNAYFLGRIVGFTFIGLLAGEVGSVIHHFLYQYHLLSFISFIVAVGLFAYSFTYFSKRSLPSIQFLNKFLGKISCKISILMLKNSFTPIFFFGFATILLPCGQSLLVFSFSALTGSTFLGALNAFCFALLTTPSLFLAMSLHPLFKKLKLYYRPLVGLSIFFIASLFLLRSLADFDLIPHLILNSKYHIAIY